MPAPVRPQPSYSYFATMQIKPSVCAKRSTDGMVVVARWWTVQSRQMQWSSNVDSVDATADKLLVSYGHRLRLTRSCMSPLYLVSGIGTLSSLRMDTILPSITSSRYLI